MKIIFILGLFLIFSLMASVSSVDAKPDKFVKDNYIIKFKEGVKPNMKHEWKITHKYSKIFNGLAVEVKNPNTMKKLLADDTIQSITPVQIFTIPLPLFAEISTIPPDIGEVQYIKPGTTRHNFHINPSVNAGDGMTNVPLIIAVVDTGCTLEHPDLNYIECHDFTNSSEGVDDLSGHGTHVAGSIAAINNDFGVVGGAPGAGIIGLKVCGQGGSNSCGSNAILAGWDWLATNGKAKGVLVNNNSWGGNQGELIEDGNCGLDNGDVFHQALCAMTDAGIVTVVSAGNSNADGETFLACGYDEVICISAMDDTDGLPGGNGADSACRASSDDTIASFSNYGSVVDISADGVCEPSTVPDCPIPGGICSDTGYLEISGTSMSGPQATGGIALAIVHLYGFEGAQNRADVLAVNNFVKGTGFPITGPDGFSCNKPSGCTEPLLNAATYTFEPRTPFHDVSISTPGISNPSGLGFTETITFNTVNLGTFQETYTIELRINGVLIFTDTVTLEELNSKNYSVEWIPDVIGTFTITTTIINPPTGDTNPDNNSISIDIEVIERIRDLRIGVFSDEKPDNWVPGERCDNCLRLPFSNLGNFADLFSATIVHVESGIVIFDRDFTIGPNNSHVFFVDVNENIVINGVNTFRAEIVTLPGDDPLGNVKILEVTATGDNQHFEVRFVLLLGDSVWDEDTSGTVRLWCSNDGTETLDNPRLSFGMFEGEQLLQGWRTAKVLKNGESVIVDFPFMPFDFTPGTHTLTGVCDYLDEFDERDETNNSGTVTITINDTGGEPPDPPPPDPEPPKDTTPPTVIITNPDDGDIVRGKVTFRISAIDDESGIKFVRLTIDGKVKVDDTSAPYNWVWQSNKPGPHIIGAFTCDNSGNCSTDTILIHVKKGKG